MKKKILLSFILICISIFAFGMLNVSAETTGTYENLYYEIENGEVTIVNCDKSVTEVEIPDKIEGYTVTAINGDDGYSGFRNCTKLTSVTIPDTVTSISDYAFRYCKSLTSIVIPDSVTEIGQEAFYGCEKLADITLSNNLISIGSGAFTDTAYYKDESNWEDGVLYIGNTLIVCRENKVGEYTIKVGTRIISDNAFNAHSNCTKLTDITIPESVIAVGYDAFYGTGYYLNESNWENGTLYIDNVLIATNEDLSSEYEVKPGTRVIGDCAFAWRDLQSVTIPDSVEYIGVSAFIDNNIENLYIEDLDAYLKCQFGNSYSVPYSSDIKAYLNGKIIEDVEIPKGVIKISDFMFRGWKSLKTVIIPDGVKSIGINSFIYCTNLTDITMPDSIESIGWGAFSGCGNLSDISLPKKLVTIYSWAFNSCTGLTKVEIPEGVMWVGADAFSGTGIKTLTLPSTLKFVGRSAFCDSFSDSAGMIYGPNIERAYISDLEAYINCKYEDSGAIPLHNGGTLYLDNKVLKNLEIPEGIEIIPDYIFCGCESLKSVVIPEGVKSIGKYAFCNCENIESITLPKSLESIGESAFCDCNIKKVYISDLKSYINCEYKNRNAVPSASNYDGCDLYLNGQLVENISIPEGISKISDYIFYSLNIKSAEIPKGVTSIGDYAFYNCINLEKIEIPDGVRIIGDYAFARCRKMTNVTTPDSVTNIGEYALSGCNNLKSVTLSNNITTISTGLLEWCKALESITIPQGVIAIRPYAFGYCGGLTSVTIPKTVQEISSNAFFYYMYSGENNLSTVYYNGTDDDWNDIFIGTGNDALTNAMRKQIYYITLIDDAGNTSSITCQPNEKIKLSDIEKKYMHKVKLYTDKVMTKEFDTEVAITDNMTLYVKLGEEITVIYGDIDDDGEITMNDAIYLFNAAMFPEQYSIPSGQKTDYNGDGNFDMNDAIYLFNHAMFPEQYPI